VLKLLNMQKSIETFEEAMDVIVHMSQALASVFSDKRKLELDIVCLHQKIEEVKREKEELDS
jgi:hypothetical protein